MQLMGTNTYVKQSNGLQENGLKEKANIWMRAFAKDIEGTG